jgi:hypothetical protein
MKTYEEVDGAEPFLTSGPHIAFEQEQTISAGTASGHSVDVDVPVLHLCDSAAICHVLAAVQRLIEVEYDRSTTAGRRELALEELVARFAEIEG